MGTGDWEQRVAALWATMDEHDATEFLTLVEKLVEELPPDAPEGFFERACALDSTGHSDLAVPLYREALAAGVTGERRRRSVIQMASSLRNLGRSQESVALLTDELKQPSDHLDDAAKAVLALALTDVGREREAVSLAVGALAAHLPRYQRSMADYARLLLKPDPAADPESDVHD
ncbi:tetratricopeptide repeat protein [Actinoplanes sp. NPDC049265]|uniref:tetratricopeptide repeat protein n=1 Tax=Actinoplanes sp. NPDC049265 TaxID=3363902 RepID=UPI00371CB272